MSRQESRTLVFFLEGDPLAKPYDLFDIPIGATVFRLKAAIKQRVEIHYSVNADTLKLWKPNVMVPIGPDHSLAQRLQDLGKVPAYSKELSSEEEVGELFPEPHSGKHLHLVVQCNELLTPSTSRKRLRTATEEDAQAAKRKEIDEVSNMQSKLRGATDMQTHCAAIYEAIKAMPDNPDLSNPSTFTDLPFPSLLQMPSQRFKKKKINNIDHFEYMGRSHFQELQKRIERDVFLDRSESLYLYGTSGSGKSHLLAALVYHLVRQGKRVFYIPDCATFELEPAKTMWKALNFAFYDSMVLETMDPHDVKGLIESISECSDLYVIVDQVNALETAGNNDSAKEVKDLALRWLRALRFNHRYVFSASANETSNRQADKKQSSISVFRIFGGMSKDETNQWFTFHNDQIPELTPEQRQWVEYFTGCIPLLLRCLLDVTKFVEVKFRNISDLRNVKSDVDIFARNKLASLDSFGKQTYLQIMDECIRGDPVTTDDRNLYDLRHFYVDGQGIGRSTCGIALEAMMSILRTRSNAPFLDDV